MRFTRRAARRTTIAAIALACAMMLVVPAAASPGSVSSGTGKSAAALEQPAGTNGSVVRMTPVPASGRVSCYGYYGTFKAGTEVMVVNWDTVADECFGIATDRTIWHVWPNSGGWRPMPGGGHADYIVNYAYEEPNGYRDIMVWIPGAAIPFWCQDYLHTTGWRGWYNCS